ncbi:MAG: hypothetical protein IPM16_14115 [Chloroflexi bacterium]|nr:hypothetical protein [Chloroflexota bacterium]
MTETTRCAECGTILAEGVACADHFHQMLAWEQMYGLGQAHHLLVASYHAQHPSLLSREGLAAMHDLLRRFVIDGEAPSDVRRTMRDDVASGNRNYPITARPGNVGAYATRPPWTMSAGDVVAGGIGDFIENVERWAASIVEALAKPD